MRKLGFNYPCPDSTDGWAPGSPALEQSQELESGRPAFELKLLPGCRLIPLKQGSDSGSTRRSQGVQGPCQLCERHRMAMVWNFLKGEIFKGEKVKEGLTKHTACLIPAKYICCLAEPFRKHAVPLVPAILKKVAYSPSLTERTEVGAPTAPCRFSFTQQQELSTPRNTLTIQARLPKTNTAKSSTTWKPFLLF